MFCFVFLNILATLIFNPIVYLIIDAKGVHYVYAVFAIILLVLGVLFSSAFRPRRDTDISSEVTSPSETESSSAHENTNETLPKRSRVILGGLWLCANLCKFLPYYGMFLVLVSKHHKDTLHRIFIMNIKKLLAHLYCM